MKKERFLNLGLKIFFLGVIFLLSFSVFYFSVRAEELKCSDYGKKVMSQEDYDKIIEICDREIAADKAALKKSEGEANGIAAEIQRLDREIKISQAYINKKTARANRLKRDIKSTIADIKELSDRLETINQTLKDLLFQRNQVEGNTALEALLSKKTLSEFFDDLNTSSYLEKKISQEVREIKKKKEDLEKLIIELEERESVERQLAREKQIEYQKIARNKKYKNELLGIKKKETGFLKKRIIDKEKAKQAILRKKFTVASGEKVTFGEAFNIINPYKRQLGMDPAFVLAILFQESGWSGKIGGNIGQCTYNQKNPCGKNRVMSESQVPSFLEIMKGLGGDPNIQKVSCPICKDGSYGGAMGPAQFMPKT